MEENSYEKFQRHIGKPFKTQIDNEEFEFKRFNFEQTALFLFLSGKLEKGDIRGLSKEDIQELLNLLKSVVMNSYPNLTEDIAKEFVANNFMQLMEIIPELLPKSISQSASETMKKRLEEYKKQNEGKG